MNLRYAYAPPADAVVIGPPAPGRSQYCLLFGVSVAGFAARGRDDEARLTIRAALYGSLRAAFRTCGIAWDACRHVDRGDGVLVVIPLHLPTVVVIDPLLPLLRAAIQRHNRLSSAIAQIRLCVAVHIGEVHRDQYGVAGVAVDHLFRLLAAPAVKEALTASGGELALIVSGAVYDGVLRPAGGLVDLDTYRPVEVARNGTRARAWVRASGGGAEEQAAQRVVAGERAGRLVERGVDGFGEGRRAAGGGHGRGWQELDQQVGGAGR